MGGLPLDANNNTVLSAAEVKPEDVSHFEIGFKASPTPGSTANLTFFNTEIEDFQTQVTNSQFGVARGYLANAEKVRVRGAEFDGNVNIGSRFALRGSVAYTDAEYVSFTDAPPPLEGTGGPASVDASGGLLPGVSEWAASVGTEYRRQGNIFGKPGEFFTGLDIYYRDDFSSSPTPSQYLNVEGYSLLNLRVGFRSDNGGWSGYLVVAQPARRGILRAVAGRAGRQRRRPLRRGARRSAYLRRDGAVLVLADPPSAKTTVGLRRDCRSRCGPAVFLWARRG